MDMKLSPDQKQVLVAIIDWYKKRPSQFLTVGGYAGTGKTTLLAMFRRVLLKAQPSVKIAFCAFTGKASRVLAATLAEHKVMSKLDKVSTIHSLIYAPEADSQGRVTNWYKRHSIEYDLIVVDEASMVDQSIWQDLLSYKIPILAVGDHGQLPPIGGSFNLMSEPELRLEKIHRQAEANPIIHLSMVARETGKIEVGAYGGGVRKLDRYDSATNAEVEEMLRQENMVLSGYNFSRIELNKQMRLYRDYESQRPQLGDKLICLKNNWKKGIYNGMVGVITSITSVEGKDGDVHWYRVELDIEDGEFLYEGKISAHQFNYPKTLDEYGSLTYRQLGDLFDFGYALTVHKAQGSQAKSVLLFEERNKHMSDEDWRRWLYTGITRAQKRLTIVGTK
jgi:exodeoxyribonuclease-5